MYRKHVTGRVRPVNHFEDRSAVGAVAYGPDVGCQRCGVAERIPDYLTSDVSRRNAWLTFYREHEHCRPVRVFPAAWTGHQWDRYRHQVVTLASESDTVPDARFVAATLGVPLPNAEQLVRWYHRHIERMKG